MFRFFRKLYSIIIALFMALISLSIILVVSKEVFKVEPNFLIAFGLSILVFIGSYSVLKTHLGCKKCKEIFSKGKIRTDTKEKNTRRH